MRHEQVDRGALMAIQNNFVSVEPSVLIDPVLRLRVDRGRWTPESSARGGSAYFHLSYDPEIRPDRLTMPIPAKQKKMMEMLGATPPESTAFQSNSSRRIAELFVDIAEGFDEVRLEFLTGDSSIGSDAELIRRERIPDVSDRPLETFYYFLSSLVAVPVIERDYALPWKKKRVSMYVERPVAKELLLAETRDTFEPLVKVASRQLEQ
jgi:hypothetical protein